MPAAATHSRINTLIARREGAMKSDLERYVNIPTGSLYGKERTFAVQSTGQLQNAKAACAVTELAWNVSYDRAKLTIHIGNNYDRY